MNIIGTFTDDELLELTLRKMERLRTLSESCDLDSIRKAKSQVHILIREVKRRNIKADEKFIAGKLLKEY
ncbi:MAG TPA: hypothetical protein GXX53_03325 [Tissierellia bacterium]|nr:hypothetical protein [Tissierellia bacterium]